MVQPNVSEGEFIELFTTIGPAEMAKQGLGNMRTILARRRTLEHKHKRAIKSPNPTARPITNPYIEHPHRIELTVKDGIVLVGSDAHVWPGPATPAWKGFVRFVRDLRPKTIIINGDTFDGASVSRHPPIGWAHQPTVVEEIEACQERLGEIEKAKPMKCRLLHPLGNHDSRFETRLASVAPQFASVKGTRLKDHFPAWEPCWSVWINGGDVVVKHRWRGGVHGVHNNTINSGATMVTGHDHALRISPFSDYRGTRWGISTGTLADPYGKQFLDYTEDNPRSHRSGFVVLTFRNGRLMWPELAYVIDEKTIGFRGEMIKV